MRFPISTARRVQSTALVGLVGLTLLACGSGSSNNPIAPTTPATPTTPTTMPVTNLAGTWAGTAKVTWDEFDGGVGCSGPVTATFAQSGAAVSATLGEVPGCLNGSLRFEGTLTANMLQ